MNKIIITLVMGMSFALSSMAGASPVLEKLKMKAEQENASFQGFDAQRGKVLFETKFGLGKAETPSCTTCHGSSPFTQGLTRAGKVIEPMASSKTPARYMDQRKVDKWFRRNCNSVLNRECSLQEKGDFLTYMMSQ
ncbi:Cytochrome c-type protein SHP [Candidatus Terasakiella magnetica]|uniref:Cytochrome c-type protein SHP n=1 Tax=Candidatus Terasakiella magnetica TaxID=1867952 RepID=A0A1C3RHX5_9PROT|nr:DUF1924 domain-containing protein [Candidatus Terasakiella magnetica]SCA56873.1 Cytochrome c-type protein SHP [Candidatus Terasakiella magnetica]